MDQNQTQNENEPLVINDQPTTYQTLPNNDNNLTNSHSDIDSSDETNPILPNDNHKTQNVQQEDEENKGWGCDLGEYIKSFLFGGLDGISTVIVSVATIYSGDVTMLYVLIIGVAKLLSGAISMGIGDFMSSRAELELIKAEREREAWECRHFLKGEKDEMVDIYETKGMKRESASKIVDVMSKKPSAFVDVMMVQELGLQSDFDEYGPLKNGLTNFFSFMFFGTIPLIIYIVTAVIEKASPNSVNHSTIFFIDCGITALTLILMGILKSRFSTENIILSATITLIVGTVAAGSGYLVAYLLEKVFHVSDVS